MNDRIALARRAVRGALETRYMANIQRTEPICVYDIAEKLGVEVRFHKANSFGGMYAKASQTILVPALRPWGRRAFTCGHELGHWYFGHGSKIDELESVDRTDNDDPEEWLANVYAGYLLMPSWAVQRAFERRGTAPGNCSPIQFYTASSQLGVGYETLISHLRWSLRSITPARAENLLSTSVKEIKSQVLKGFPETGHLVISDEFWETVPIDIQVGDRVILPKDAVIEGASATPIGQSALGLIAEGRIPGIARAESRAKSWAVFIRVSHKDFAGRSIYRHIEDPDVE